MVGCIFVGALSLLEYACVCQELVICICGSLKDP